MWILLWLNQTASSYLKKLKIWHVERMMRKERQKQMSLVKHLPDYLKQDIGFFPHTNGEKFDRKNGKKN